MTLRRGAAIAGATLALLGAVPADRPAVLEGVATSLEGDRANAVVYLVPLDAPFATAPQDSAVIDQSGLRFTPRILVTTPGTRVEFLNSDPILHNVFSPPGVGADFDLGTYPRGERRGHVFAETGAYAVLCHVHPEMLAHVVVVPTRWIAITDSAGRFRIADVPPGRYHVRVWHRHLRAAPQVVTLAEGATSTILIALERSARRRGTSLQPAAPR